MEAVGDIVAVEGEGCPVYNDGLGLKLIMVCFIPSAAVLQPGIDPGTDLRVTPDGLVVVAILYFGAGQDGGYPDDGCERKLLIHRAPGRSKAN